MPLDPEFKEKWCTALESGDYKQGNGSLRSDSGYCCLGVALEVEGKGKWQAVGYNFQYVDGEDDSISVALPKRAFFSRTGLEENQAYELADMNDSTSDYLGKHSDFKQIAKFIRENY